MKIHLSFMKILIIFKLCRSLWHVEYFNIATIHLNIVINIVEILLKLGYIHEKNDSNIQLSKELNVCQMGVDTIMAIYLWNCYLFLAILSKASLETWLGLAKILKGQHTDMSYRTSN